jgi:hypothetical protein
MNNDTPIADLILASCKIAKRQLLDELLADLPNKNTERYGNPEKIAAYNAAVATIRAIIEEKREGLL